MLHRPLPVAIILAVATSVLCTTAPLSGGERLTLHSKILGEDRTVLASLPESLPGQDASPLARIRPAMQRFVEQNEIAGAVTVVGRRDSILSIEAVGYLNIEKQTPMPKNAIFRLASMTKPITAIGIMILQEEGKLTIDDPVEKHLPEFKGQMMVAEKKPESLLLKKPSRPITLKDLLTHTSGLAGQYPEGLRNLYQTRDRTLAESVLAISQPPLVLAPGSGWSHC